MLWNDFSDIQSGVKLQFRTSDGPFNHQCFKARIQPHTSIIRDLLFADSSALVATSLEEAQELLDRFSVACKAFGLNISIKKTEVIHQTCFTSKQIQGGKQRPTGLQFS